MTGLLVWAVLVGVFLLGYAIRGFVVDRRLMAIVYLLGVIHGAGVLRSSPEREIDELERLWRR